MSTGVFQITEHSIPAGHVREYHNASTIPNPALRLAIKEYRPWDNFDAPDGSVTLIGAHGNGCPKECYEALWEDLYLALKEKHNHSIRAIWIADISNQGYSGIMNEKIQGDDPNWLDHSRDMLHMINYFRDSMPQPLMGVGHSMGATQIVHLSILHPRLLHSLALIEPIILENGPKEGPNVALASSFRKDFWATRDAAEASIRKSKFFGTWNKRALEKYIEHGLRSTPTALYPDHKHSGGTTLTTTKHQEAWSFLRPNFAPNDGSRDEHIRAPDSSPEHRTHLFHRAEMASANRNLPFVRPHVLWIFGEKSAVSAPEFREDKLKRTGTGVGGSGGQAMGQVEAVTISDGQHMLPFERTQELAQILADWIEKQLESYRKEEDWHRKNKSGKSERNMLALSESWLKNVKQKENTPRPKI